MIIISYLSAVDGISQISVNLFREVKYFAIFLLNWWKLVYEFSPFFLILLEFRTVFYPNTIRADLAFQKILEKFNSLITCTISHNNDESRWKGQGDFNMY